ncbi:hypothetical protein DBR32_09635 [Taibaiella sp. KBW10]|nr:hypothetical protein DBR32_09635 [Taibaiella sp. KBW10]
MVVVLFKAGDQVPITPLDAVSGNGAKLVPAHIGATCVNVGDKIGLTATVIVTLVPHCPESGVKV